jgi:hypothetical protein
VGHHEPPEVAWLPPELEIGEEPELKPLELELELEPDELEPVEPEPVEPEPVEPEPVEPEPVEPELDPVELEPEPVEAEPEPAEPAEDEPDEPVEPVEPVEDALVVCADPGRARARAPAVTTPATVTAVVVDRTLFRPRSLAATAWRIPSSRRALLMSLILRPGARGSLHEPSG